MTKLTGIVEAYDDLLERHPTSAFLKKYHKAFLEVVNNVDTGYWISNPSFIGRVCCTGTTNDPAYEVFSMVAATLQLRPNMGLTSPTRLPGGRHKLKTCYLQVNFKDYVKRG